MKDRVLRDFTLNDIEKIAGTFRAWRADTENLKLKTVNSMNAYADVAGFCKSATIEEIAAHGFVLTPGRYVGAEEQKNDGEPFEKKLARLVGELNGQFAESTKLEESIKENLARLGYGS